MKEKLVLLAIVSLALGACSTSAGMISTPTLPNAGTGGSAESAATVAVSEANLQSDADDATAASSDDSSSACAGGRYRFL
jgi:hypothetical protein